MTSRPLPELCEDCKTLLVAAPAAPRHPALEDRGRTEVRSNRGQVDEAYHSYRCTSCGTRWRREESPTGIAGRWSIKVDD